jgi:hypothetical protein
VLLPTRWNPPSGVHSAEPRSGAAMVAAASPLGVAGGRHSSHRAMQPTTSPVRRSDRSRGSTVAIANPPRYLQAAGPSPMAELGVET